jgi:TonB family protein
MTGVVRVRPEAVKRSVAFFGSGLVHVLLLLWVAFGTLSRPAEPRQSLYDMTIRGKEKRIVWYRLADKMPEVRPAEAAPKPAAKPRPLRALRKFDQSLVVGKREEARTPRMVWAPAPVPSPPKPQPLPNLIAVEEKPLVKPFVAPRPKAVTPAAPALPDAPVVTAKLGAAPAGPELKALVKRFVRPVEKAETAPAAVVPDAPAAPGQVPAVTVAIVGLDPAKAVDIPAPPPPSPAEFSAGPKPAPHGAETDSGEAAIRIPGLTASGGARDRQATLVPRLGPPSMSTLLAGVRAAPAMGGLPPAPHAAHVSSSPDPMLDGREVYSIAIQMPNVTSYSGSWIVWFAEHEKTSATGEVRPPVPLRKVDPKYVASAAAEGVEGIVRLGAVIRRDGHVDTIQVLRHLDQRLDATATEALGKWIFEPAVRNGVPLDVDAVFEIPFRLAPKSAK